MRGNLRELLMGSLVIRSIPAYAGEPYWAGSANSVNRVYPRVCGGTLNILNRGSIQPGLSPRMRGNRQPPQSG